MKARRLKAQSWFISFYVSFLHSGKIAIADTSVQTQGMWLERNILDSNHLSLFSLSVPLAFKLYILIFEHYSLITGPWFRLDHLSNGLCPIFNFWESHLQFLNIDSLIQFQLPPWGFFIFLTANQSNFYLILNTLNWVNAFFIFQASSQREYELNFSFELAPISFSSITFHRLL